jgi:hypothetical protein
MRVSPVGWAAGSIDEALAEEALARLDSRLRETYLEFRERYMSGMP